MSRDTEQLVVTLEARVNDFQRQMQRAERRASQSFGTMERRAQQAGKRMEDSLRSSTANINRLLSGLGVGISLNELRNLAETWTDLTSRVNIAAGSQEQGAAVMARVSQIARRTYSDLSQTANAYVANSQALKDLGYSTQTQLDYTEALNNALVVSNAKGQQAESVMDALSKAMANGELRGDNLNTVIGTGGRVAQALADGLGVTVTELRALGQQGKLTSDVVVKALTGELGKLREEAESMPATISDALVLLRNSLTQYVGKLNEANGVTSIFSDGIILVADNIETIAAGAATAGLVISGKYVPGLVRATAAQAAMIATNPFLLLVSAIGAATFALSAFGDQITPIEGDLANMQDYAGAAWTAIKEGAYAAGTGINDTLVTAINFISEAIGGAEVSFGDLADFVKSVTNQIIGELGLVYDTVRIAFTKLPGAVAEAVVNAMNSMIAGIESGLNGVVEAVNSTITSINSVGERVGVSLGTISSVTLGRITNAYEGAGAAAGEAFADAMRNAGNDHVGAALGAWRNAANQRAQDRLANQPEAPQIDSEDNPVARARPGSGKGSGGGGSGRGGRGRGGRGGENEFDRQVGQINERIAALKMETEARRGLTGTLDQQDAALERAHLRHELLVAAQKAGLAITPELENRINALADAYSSASLEAQALAKSQEDAAQRADEFKSMSSDLLKGFVSDLRSGKGPLDALLSGLDKIADKLLDMALSNLFENALGGLGGGLFGKLFGFANGGEVKGYATGGHVRGPGTGRSDSIPAMLSNGEYVINARSTAKHRALLDAINSGTLPAFADGGPVGRARKVGNAGAASAGQSITIAPAITVNANGGTPEQNADLARQTAKAAENSIRAIVQQEFRSATRPGGILR
ncbi:tape measure protein [Aureimonas altamirensis]|uniref:tape measure protein n=1 Tax=Aureimonas altamirensis TaxID=370622 RepID=UPI00203671FF|nr:tape measure protein [Aureimonas altamirensis]MCM2504102.1 tape measure protein [Aureimonas altamirensis]